MILITTQNFPPDRGGMENLMGGLAEELAGRGQRVSVFTGPILDGGAPLEATRYRIRRFGGWRFWWRRRKAAVVAATVRAGGVQGVFADSWKSAELLPELGIPLVILSHGMEFPVNPSPRKYERIRRTLAAADTVIANSVYTASLVKPYLADESRITVINPPIGPQPQPDPEKVAALRARIGDGGPVLFTLARLEPRKGVDMVIRALPAIRDRYPQAVYLVAGGGDDRARLEGLAAAEGVADAVHFLGGIDDADKAALYSLSDLFAMPARREGDSVEGFGIVYREANWYGVPALAGREGGAADAVTDGETGLLCDGADPADVSARILQLLDDPAARRRMGEKAAEVARGAAQWRESIGAFLAALG
ncbi:glycosyltransferase family 4 protein [Microbulbifer halophilus]|uniref:Glycosyltransferase family 4 protein n=1 Tax=Microbulbifer halophilus TaxID=453963 RepID=A0ABW5E766_9GAMM|nr:glycosyltransferase family 4 protein [Microbulbifer halophilus]MCW8126796.1 glycosyltransferase family 4 protein [Microbulbifer halophilus]